MWGWREREQTKREWVKKKQPKFNTRERNCITKWQKNNNNNTTTSEMHSFRIWMNFCISAARLLDRFGCCSKYSHTTKTTTKKELEILQSNELKTYNTSQNVNQMQNILINLSTITTPPDLYICFSFFFLDWVWAIIVHHVRTTLALCDKSIVEPSYWWCPFSIKYSEKNWNKKSGSGFRLMKKRGSERERRGKPTNLSVNLHYKLKKNFATVPLLLLETQ